MVSTNTNNNVELTSAELTSTSSFLSMEYVDALDFNSFGNGLPCILGIDEAGRGPVLGPMVYGCAAMLADKENDLKELGIEFISNRN